jgi:hypothetical protein
VCQLKCSIARKYVGTTHSLVAYGGMLVRRLTTKSLPLS